MRLKINQLAVCISRTFDCLRKRREDQGCENFVWVKVKCGYNMPGTLEPAYTLVKRYENKS